MDRSVALDARGSFPVQAGVRYRFLVWIANKAFDTWLPWNAPGEADIQNAVTAAGFADAVLYPPYRESPPDWPKDEDRSRIPEGAFIVRGEGTWRGTSSVLPLLWPMAGYDDGALHLVQLWMHTEPAPSPAPWPNPWPGPRPSPPGPRPSPPSPSPAPRPRGGRSSSS